MRVFITGANGFIGGAVASALITKATVSVASFVTR